VCQLNHIAWNGAASQPSAGQARSPQQALSPQKALSPQQACSPREPHFLRLCHRRYAAANPNHDAKRAALAFAFDLRRPVNHAGRNSALIWGVNRQGCRVTPKSMSDYGHTEPRRGAEWWGKAFLVTFGALPKVTRRKGGTHSRRERSNGYVLGLTQLPGRLSGRHRGQAPSHS